MRPSFPRATALLLALLVSAPAEAQIIRRRAAEPPAAAAAALYQRREAAASPALKLKLQAFRDDIKKRGGTFQVRATTVLDLPEAKVLGSARTLSLAEIAKTNERAVKILQAETRAVDAALAKDPSLRFKIPLFKLAPKPNLPRWDWRGADGVTPARQQLGGTCWCYAPIGAFEASMRVRNGQTVDASEQYVISNSGAGSIVFPPGGDSGKVPPFLASTGTLSEAACPDTGTQGTPDPKPFKPYRASAFGFLAQGGKASVAELKAALCEHGPLVTQLYASGAFMAYGGGGTVVDDGFENQQINHSVLLIGWDDAKQAWLIKNSWGAGWGDECGHGTEGGFGWVKYGCRNIGTYSFWLHAYPTFVDPKVYQLALKELKVDMSGMLLPAIQR